MTNNKHVDSILTPLKYLDFRYLWIATLISNMGTWMHIVGSRWLMLSFSNSPFMVGLVQASMAFPVFLFTLPAGILGDGLNKAKILFITQTWMGIASLLIGILTFFHKINPLMLLAGTFVLGTGAALNLPAWQAFIPSVIPEKELKKGIILNSIAFNMACLIGPVLGGILVGFVGSYIVFILDSISYFVVSIYFALYIKRTASIKIEIPSTKFNVSDIKNIILQSRLFLSIITRVFIFFFSANCIWTLLPILSKIGLHANANIYGILLAFLGSGAVFGGWTVNKLKNRYSDNTIVNLAAIFTGISFYIISLTKNMFALEIALFFCGFSWISISSTLNTLALKVFSSNFHSRALAVYMIVFNAALVFSSLFWGKIASIYTYSTALTAAALFLVLTTFISNYFNLIEKI